MGNKEPKWEVLVTAMSFTHAHSDVADRLWLGKEEGSPFAHPPVRLGQTCSGASLLQRFCVEKSPQHQNPQNQKPKCRNTQIINPTLSGNTIQCHYFALWDASVSSSGCLELQAGPHWDKEQLTLWASWVCPKATTAVCGCGGNWQFPPLGYLVGCSESTKVLGFGACLWFVT